MVDPTKIAAILKLEVPRSVKKLLDAQLFAMHILDGHFEDIIHFLMTGNVPEGYTIQ